MIKNQESAKRGGFDSHRTVRAPRDQDPLLRGTFRWTTTRALKIFPASTGHILCLFWEAHPHSSSLNLLVTVPTVFFQVPRCWLLLMNKYRFLSVNHMDTVSSWLWGLPPSHAEASTNESHAVASSTSGHRRPHDATSYLLLGWLSGLLPGLHQVLRAARPEGSLENQSPTTLTWVSSPQDFPKRLGEARVRRKSYFSESPEFNTILRVLLLSNQCLSSYRTDLSWLGIQSMLSFCNPMIKFGVSFLAVSAL